MSGLDFLRSLKGRWSGENQLWLPPHKLPIESQTTATVTPLLGGRFVRLDYTWAFEGEAQEGSYLFGYETKKGLVSAAWIDSWHNAERMMICQGKLADHGGVDVLGSYPAPPGPDWGWRTIIEPTEPAAFRLLMFNITPEGNEELAVEASFKRRKK
jgi:hypothetical protein